MVNEWREWIRSNILEIIIKEQASESQKITEGKETEKPLENETIVQKQSTEQISQP